ncbi:RNB domain-containing ribonuclease [Deltaproteobacteria bacterium TL4]
MELTSVLHHYCLYFKDGNPTFGWVRDIQKSKLIIVPLQGKELFFAPNHIIMFWKNNKLLNVENAALEQLKVIIESVQHQVASIDIETIHALSEPGQTYTLETLAADFLDSPENSVQRLSLWFSLYHDSRWFKRTKNNEYVPRTPEELAQLEHQNEKKKKQELWSESVSGWVNAIEAQVWKKETPIDENQAQWLQQLQSLLVHGKNSNYWKEQAPLLNLGNELTDHDECKLRKWLFQVGKPISWCRLMLLRANVREEFKSSLENEAASLTKSNFPENQRDWLKTLTVTIDSEKTKDYDDAISILGWNNSSIQLAVQIADVASFIAPNSSLFEEAEKRVSSVYTLKRVFPMFPPSLADELFSLKAGKIRSVISFNLNLFQSGEYKLIGIERGKIRVEENLSYTEADQRIQAGEQFWKILYEYCLILKQNRIAQGALDINRQEIEVDISDEKNIQITSVDRNTPSNMIIQELAILVNQEVGRLFHQHQFPAIYRTQPPYQIVQEPKDDEELTMRHIRIDAARLSTVSEPHAGLGCDFYIQATSPIRRLLDLIIQHQLHRYLDKKEPLFNEEPLMNWAQQIDTQQKIYGKVEQNILFHWKTKYLNQHVGEVFHATIRRHIRETKTEVELDEIAYLLQIPYLSKCSEGETINLLIEQVNLEQHKVFARPCNPQENET